MIDIDGPVGGSPAHRKAKSGKKNKAAPGRPSPRQRRTQQERSAEARERLLSAAIALICEIGYSRTSLTEIARRAGMTRGAIQHHFAGRETLVPAILDTLERQIISAFEQVALDQHISKEEKLDAIIEGSGAVAQSDAYLAVVDIWVATRADPVLAAPLRELTARAARQYRALWNRIFKNDIRASGYQAALRLVVGMLRGIAMSRLFEVPANSIELTIAVCKDAARRCIMVEMNRTPDPQPRAVSD
jgi:AcrR family transcriptional regulator